LLLEWSIFWQFAESFALSDSVLTRCLISVSLVSFVVKIVV